MPEGPGAHAAAASAPAPGLPAMPLQRPTARRYSGHTLVMPARPGRDSDSYHVLRACYPPPPAAGHGHDPPPPPRASPSTAAHDRRRHQRVTDDGPSPRRASVAASGSLCLGLRERVWREYTYSIAAGGAAAGRVRDEERGNLARYAIPKFQIMHFAHQYGMYLGVRCATTITNMLLACQRVPGSTHLLLHHQRWRWR